MRGAVPVVLAGFLALLVALPPATAQLPGNEAFPDHAEVMAALEAAEASDWVTLHHVGASVLGKELVVAEIADPSSPAASAWSRSS